MKTFLKICVYIIPSIIVILICLNLHNTGFSSYIKKHEYQCKVIGGEKTCGRYKHSGHMYLILQEVNTGKIFSTYASPEDYYVYHNKPGTILTYTFKEYFIFPNKTYNKYRNIFLIILSFLPSFIICLPILIEEYHNLERFKIFWISLIILFITTLISYNFII